MLKKQAITSIRWTTFQTVFAGVIGPITLIFESRFLSPVDFAYLSIVLVVIGIFSLVENFGLSQAIIQKGIVSKQESSSIFVFNIFFTALLAAFVYIASNWIGQVYSMPSLDHYLKLVSIIVFVNGPSLLFRAFLEKEIRFKQLSIVEISRSCINFVGIIVLLYLDFGVLGVIYANILSTIVASGAIIFYAVKLTTVELSFYFRFYHLHPFLRFGFFVSGKQTLTFAAQRLDELVIGYFISPEVLGVYHFGKQMLEKLRTLMTNSFSKVLYPVFVKLHTDRIKLSDAYQKISKIIAIGAFPVFTGVAVTADLFVPLVFGEQWVDSIIVFQVFSIAMIFQLLTANVATALLYSVKKPNIVFYVELAINSIYFVNLFLFASKGIIVILVVFSLYIISKTICLQYFVNRELVQKFWCYFKDLLGPALFSLIMVIAVSTSNYYLKSFVSSKLVLLLSSFLVGCLVYISLSYYYARGSLRGIIELFKNKSVRVG